MNEHLVDFNNKSLPEITLDLAKAQPYSGGRSGLVPNGNYELETVDVTVKERKSGGYNLQWTDRVVGPAGSWEGTTIITTHPAPFGEEGSQAVKDGNSWMMTRLGAYTSHKGSDASQFKAPGAKVSADTFRGKRFFAALKQGQKKSETEDYSDRSQIDTYLSRPQAEAALGPRGAGRQASGGPTGATGADLLGAAQRSNGRAANDLGV